MIRTINVSHIRQAVAQAISAAAYQLPPDYLHALEQARQRERSSLGESIIIMLQDNAQYASAEQIPTCQDTGMAMIFLDIGQDVHLIGGDITQALNAAVRDGYADLRKSVVSDPLIRQNSGDNSPAILHFNLVPGNKVNIQIMLKGFGAELMSRLQMFPPSAGVEGIKQFVLETIELAGPNACPPIIVGVGIGSSFDGVGGLAKKALLRPLGTHHPEQHIAQLEKELLEIINATGIGPQGLGGSETALAVHVETFPTHIAALPVAVNLNCSAPRRLSITI